MRHPQHFSSRAVLGGLDPGPAIWTEIQGLRLSPGFAPQPPPQTWHRVNPPPTHHSSALLHYTPAPPLQPNSLFLPSVPSSHTFHLIWPAGLKCQATWEWQLLVCKRSRCYHRCCHARRPSTSHLYQPHPSGTSTAPPVKL